MNDPLKPSVSVLCKLGSIARHLEEIFENGHEFDIIAMKDIIRDEEIEIWMEQMDQQALLPVKR